MCRCGGKDLVQGLGTQGGQELLTEVSCAELDHGLTEGGANLLHGWDGDGRMRERDEEIKE